MSSKNSLDWEVPVETVPIPSMGMIYGEDSFFFNKTTVDIRAMTAKEEDILLSQAYIKKGTVIDELIKSCIVGDGSKINVDDLIAGDRNALCISIRITGYGANYNLSVKCKNCYKKNDINIAIVSHLTSFPGNWEKQSDIYKRICDNLLYYKFNMVLSPQDLSLFNYYDRVHSFKRICPGIRLKESNDDQVRVSTPEEAISNGADYLVIGRPLKDNSIECFL